MDAITRLCDRVLWLNSGRIVQIGHPEDVVAEYQKSAWASINRKKKTRKGGGHVCKGGEILFVRLTSSNGKEIGAARVDDDVWIDVGFKTAIPDVSVRANIDVSANGVTAFRSVQPEPVPVEGFAEGIAKVRIPAHLLTETMYSVTASLAFFTPDEPYTCILDNALAFQVYDPARGDSARGKFHGRMPGLIAPRLEWQLKALPAAPVSEDPAIRHG
jgi:lipopolysaccharide transport system ATP-binding protein